MRIWRVSVLVCLLVATGHLGVSSALDEEDYQRAPRIIGEPFIIVDIKDIADTVSSFEVTVSGKPLPENKGWFQDIGSSRWEKDLTNRFSVTSLNSTQDEDSKTFQLNIFHPNKRAVGLYGVKFSNEIGEVIFRFEIRGDDDKDSELLFNVIIPASSAGGFAIVLIIVVVIVCRRRSCRRRRRRRRRRRSTGESQNTQSEVSRASQQSHEHRTSSSNDQKERYSQEYEALQSPPNQFRRPSRKRPPKAPPKPQHVPRHSSEDPTSFALDPVPFNSKPCPCPTLPTSKYPGYIKMHGRGDIYPKPTELAEAILTLRHLRKRPDLSAVDNSLLKSKRLSRSVPSLYQEGLNITMPRMRPPQLHHPLPPIPPLTPATLTGYGRSAHDDRQNGSDNRGRYGSGGDSGFEWEDEGQSDFASISVVAESFRRRPHSSEGNGYRFIRRSLQISSEQLRDEEDLPGGSSARQSENKYVSMSGFDLPEQSFPPPPPPICGTENMKMRVYENLPHTYGYVGCEFKRKDDCEECESGLYCRR